MFATFFKIVANVNKSAVILTATIIGAYIDIKIFMMERE